MINQWDFKMQCNAIAVAQIVVGREGRKQLRSQLQMQQHAMLLHWLGLAAYAVCLFPFAIAMQHLSTRSF